MQVASKRTFREDPILVIEMESTANYSVIHWSGEVGGSTAMAVETTKEESGVGQVLEFHTGIALNFRQTHAWVCASDDQECFDITMFKFKVQSCETLLKLPIGPRKIYC